MKPTDVVKEQREESLKHHDLEMMIAEMFESAGFEITRLSVSEEMTTEYSGVKMGLHIHLYSNKLKKYPGKPEGWPI